MNGRHFRTCSSCTPHAQLGSFYTRNIHVDVNTNNFYRTYTGSAIITANSASIKRQTVITQHDFISIASNHFRSYNIRHYFFYTNTNNGLSPKKWSPYFCSPVQKYRNMWTPEQKLLKYHIPGNFCGTFISRLCNLSAF